MIRIEETCHKLCFSLGFHVDFKNKYIDFHIGRMFIEFGNHEASYLKEPYAQQLRDLNDEYRKKSDEIVKGDPDHHPLLI